MNFENMYLGRFEVDDEQKLLYDLAEEYHTRTEAYDRSICTGPIGHGGGILPDNREEYIRINRNALEVKKDILQRYGVDKRKLQKAISNHYRKGIHQPMYRYIKGI